MAQQGRGAGGRGACVPQAQLLLNSANSAMQLLIFMCLTGMQVFGSTQRDVRREEGPAAAVSCVLVRVRRRSIDTPTRTHVLVYTYTVPLTGDVTASNFLVYFSCRSLCMLQVRNRGSAHLLWLRSELPDSCIEGFVVACKKSIENYIKFVQSRIIDSGRPQAKPTWVCRRPFPSKQAYSLRYELLRSSERAW